ncbi:PREDICTED: leucine-rich repeat-containing protein 20 isoform X2 [Leptosomus discolor]|uniref:leucine-rich repeat-containing protein 20 isoform X2 n=1 Tax=Leptosomus discolor TaxID=188344 RepID=UPI0005227032|nr:PREDICTED: leucine-rich repeat-containing protein 20 isoform X2 [Leptosomus discolor]
MQKRMGEAVARVARKVNNTVENKTDSLELNLAGNYLHRLPEEVTSLLHLRAINLSRNRFRHFPEPLAAVAALETIDLEENEIAEVPVDKLATMASLRSLNLRANPVGPEVRLLIRPLVPFDLLLSPEKPVPKA